jgi:uncharacterized protein YecE (DUF72 family)
MSSSSTDPRMGKLITCLRRMIDEVTSVLGMSFFQFPSYGAAVSLLDKCEQEEQAGRPFRMVSSCSMSLSPLIEFGTSTWAYEGWQGLVYHKPYPKKRFKQDCLGEYATYEYQGERLFKTVGFDFTFYGPPSPELLRHYAAQLPPGFRVCPKVWEEITVPVFPPGLRYRKKAGPNPHFLDVDYFLEMVLPPFDEAFFDHTGPFMFEFQRSGIEPADFLPKLDAFLSRLPKRFEYGVEVRTPSLLGLRYYDILKAHGVAHVYNHLYGMPSLLEQHQSLGKRFPAPFTIMRLLTPRNMKYHEAVKAYEPYSKIVQPLAEMRKETVGLINQAVTEHIPARVLVNNRLEGSAPLTVQALVDELRGRE